RKGHGKATPRAGAAPRLAAAVPKLRPWPSIWRLVADAQALFGLRTRLLPGSGLFPWGHDHQLHSDSTPGHRLYLGFLLLPDLTSLSFEAKITAWLACAVLLSLVLMRHSYSFWLALDFWIEPWEPAGRGR